MSQRPEQKPDEAQVPAERSAPEEVPDIPAEVLERVPEPQRTHIRELLAFGTFPVQNPVLRQIRPEHVSKLLDNQGRASELQREDRSEGRKYGVALAAFLALLGVGLIALLSLADRSEDLSLVLQYLLPFVGGLGGGYALAEYRHRGE